MLWNGDKTTELIERYMFDEFAIPGSARSDFRKSLALIAEPEYDLDHFFKFLGALLIESAPSGRDIQKHVIRSLRTTALALSILFRWAEAEGNLRNALLAAERNLLWGWEAIRANGLAENKLVLKVYSRLFSLYKAVASAYFMKLQARFHTRDGLSQSREGAIVTERLFEQIGLVALTGIVLLHDPGEEKKPSEVAADALVAMIENNKASMTPCYDGHAIDIALALLLLVFVQRHTEAKDWVGAMVRSIGYCFQLDCGFPISTDSFDDLVELRLDGDRGRVQRLKDLSTMLPMLAEWCAILGEAGGYQSIVSAQSPGGFYEGTCFQLWYPDKQSGETLYLRSARDFGTTEAPITLPATLEELRERVSLIRDSGHFMKLADLSNRCAGVPFIDLIACRHFRTPIPPEYWHSFLYLNKTVDSVLGLDR